MATTFNVVQPQRSTSVGGYSRTLPGFSGVATIAQLVEHGRQRAAWLYRQIDRRLGESRYLGGAVGLGMPGNCHNIKRWHAVVSPRPATRV